METKLCGICKQILPTTEFSQNKTKKDGLQHDCKKCHRQYRNKHYQDNKQYYIDKNQNLRIKNRKFINRYKSFKGCCVCGIKNPIVLEFHHKDPQQKESTIGGDKISTSINKIKTEIRKCDVLCANCHRILHWKIRQKT